uniref:Mitochondrial carrier protein n=1 Tax=Ditylenchus dipsaci TaxID=166011 RepID=A0A915E047_9BILA
MSKKDPLKNFIAGGIGDLTKTAISGSYDCFMKTVSSEGIPALYKAFPFLWQWQFPFSAIFFGGCALGRFVFKISRISNILLEPSNWCYGCGFTSLVASPLIESRVLCKSTCAVKYEGPFEVLVKLFKEGGVKISIKALLGHDCALYMAVYDLLKKKLSNNSDVGNLSPGLLSIIGAGGTAGLVVGLLSLPLDVLKSRLQVAPHGKYPKGYAMFLKKYGTRKVQSMYQGLFSAVGFLCLVGFFLPVRPASWVSKSLCLCLII